MNVLEEGLHRLYSTNHMHAQQRHRTSLTGPMAITALSEQDVQLIWMSMSRGHLLTQLLDGMNLVRVQLIDLYATKGAKLESGEGTAH